VRKNAPTFSQRPMPEYAFLPLPRGQHGNQSQPESRCRSSLKTGFSVTCEVLPSGCGNLPITRLFRATPSAHWQAIPVAAYHSVMARRNTGQGWQAITVVVLAFALLMALLPHHDHLSVAMTRPLLVMAFLFGTIDVPSSLWRISLSIEPYSPQSPDLPSRFQRPPPALF
jgi:hypothetical protein